MPARSHPVPRFGVRELQLRFHRGASAPPPKSQRRPQGKTRPSQISPVDETCPRGERLPLNLKIKILNHNPLLGARDYDFESDPETNR